MSTDKKIFSVSVNRGADMKKDRLFRIDQVCEILSISRRQVYRLIEYGALETVSIGIRGKRVTESSINRFIKTNIENNS